MNVYIGTLYKEVEYIQSSGTQFIDTGYLITPTTEVSIDYQYTNANNQDWAFGVGSDSNTSSGMTFCSYIGTTRGVAYFKAGLSDGTGSSTFTNNGPGIDTNRHKFVLNNGHFLTYNSSGILQKDVTTSATFTRTATHSFGLFCWWRTDTSAWSNMTSAKLYGCKVTDNGVLQRDFVPCYRVSDNVIGLFDKVENKFYANAGTGTFTKGNDVKVFQPELKNAYIGEVWTPGSNTLLYIPLDSTNTKNDIYGGNTTTQLGTIRYGTYGGVDCADFTTGGCIYSNMLNGVSTYTVLIWANNINGNSASDGYGGNVFSALKSGVSHHPGIYYGNSSSSNGYFTFYANNSSGDIYFNTNTKSHWFLFAICISSSTKKSYLFGDGSYKELDISRSTTNSQYAQIGSVLNPNDLTERTDRRFYGYLSNLIIENKARTAQEISHYYDITKANYGL